jgi:HEPN domain-containing protein
MQPDRRSTAAAWRAGAAQDLRIALLLAENEANAACFHAQQSAEKALKCALVFAVDDVPRSHVGTTMLDELARAGFSASEDVRDAVRVLDRYYAPTRYPDAVGDIDPSRLYTVKDSMAAIEFARCVIAFCDEIEAATKP